LHGGSGVPSAMVNKAAKLPGGGISKVNIATDLELAFLEALDKKESMTNIESEKLDSSDLKKAQKAVEKTVIDKIKNFLESDGSAPDLNF
ncbi:MAG: class II fructose-bisphosphate aldolase, partial [Halanaerobiales bacterium]